MFKKILVPLMASRVGGRALPYAVALARRCGAEVVLVHALGAPGDGDDAAARAAAAQADHEVFLATQGLREQGAHAEGYVYEGEAATAILEAAADHQVDLIVMATRARGDLARWIFGSVGNEVLRRAPVPTLVVPPSCTRQWPEEGRGQVLAALDGSPFAEQALPAAATLARSLGAGLTLLRVVEAPDCTQTETQGGQPFDEAGALGRARRYLEVATARLADPGLVVEQRAVLGRAAAAIAEAAQDEAIWAVGLASHGRGGVSRLLFGSVAAPTLRQSPAPVLVTRPACG